MQSSIPAAGRQARNDASDAVRRPGHPQMAIRTNLPPGVRSRSDDSWVEVSSQPSSSSLSSVNDEIITDGLHVQHGSNARRRRRIRQAYPMHWQIRHQREASAGGGSSQEEYEESESESDRVMSSSNEGLQPSPLRQEIRRSVSQPNYAYASSENLSDGEGEDDDDDENATAINYPRSTEPAFTPQPNIFNHPPPTQAARPQASYFPPSRPTARPANQRHSYPAQHSPFDVIAPASYPADHDAALRASLSTLLSLGAAARGLKPEEAKTNTRAGPSSNRIDTNTLRMVPESVALGEEPRQPSGTRTTTTASRSPSADKHKRKAAITASGTGRSSSKDRRAVKKVRRTPSSATNMDGISPTLLTWVVSAGVVVLVSALSFSAGYVVGRETGRAEALEVAGGGNCGKEVLAEAGRTGLRRLRWTGGTTSVVA